MTRRAVLPRRAPFTPDDLGALAESIPHIAWIANADGSTRYFNHQGTEYTGTSPDANNGWGWVDRVHPDDADRARRGWGEATRTGSPFAMEFRVRGADGEFRRHAHRGLPLRGADGELVAWVGTATDIEDERRLGERLKQAEQDAAETVTLLETLQSAAPVGVGFIDRELRVIRLNVTLAAINGADLEDQLARPLAELLPGLWLQLEPVCQGVLDSGEAVVNLDVSGETATDPGVVHHWLGSYYPIRLDEAVIGVGIVMVDVTELTTADAALAASEERFRLLAERSQDVVYRVSTVDRRLEYISPAAATLTGYTPAEFYADPELWTRLVHPDDRAIAERRPREPAEIAAPAVLRWVARDGSTVWTEHRSVPVFDDDGALVAVEGVARDVTRSVEAEALLRESEARFREFLSEIEIGALMLDASARIVFINDHLLEILGRPRDEMLASDWFAMLPDRERADVQEAFGRAFESGNISGSREHGILTRSGEERRLLWTSVLQKDAVGNVIGVASIAHDVTELHRAEDELILEARVRGLLGEAIAAAEGTSSLEEAASAVCDGLASLPGIHVVDLVGFLGPADAVVVARRGPDGLPGPGDQLSEARARYLQERAAAGAWGERPDIEAVEGELSKEMRAVGIKALAFGPIRHGDDVVGVLVVGTRDSRFAAVVADKMPPLVSFGASSNTVLVERLEARLREYRLRGTFDALLATRAFHPVFQPIVELSLGETIGYEALTRFDSGERPDVCFADAWSVGMGAELELATLEAAIAAARGLPAGRWLDLNVSPRLLQSPERLTALLDAADRPVVVEITEHELIEDYTAVREAAAALGTDVRLAVDDAGVGIANFGHIIELRPDFVKIDISLVRRVNADPGRQALVVAMRHFARTAGCRLVAEGVESDEEARTLKMLGVEFAQGHWFGLPEPAEHWAEGSPAE